MALSQNLELTAGPAVVQAPGYKTPLATTVTAVRGTLPLSTQCLSAGVAANLPTGAVLFYGLKLASALKGAWLALCQLSPVDTVNSPGLWTGSLALNTDPIRAAMHADPADPLAESPSLTCVSEFYYTLPAVDGVTPDPVGALSGSFVVLAPLCDDSASVAPAPSPNAPIQPVSEFLALSDGRLADFTQGLDLTDRTAITHIAPAVLVHNARIQNAYGGAVSQNLGTNPLDQSTVDGGLAALAALGYSGGTYVFGGGVPTGTTTHLDEIYTLGFTAVNLASLKAAGTVTYCTVASNTNLSVTLDPTISLSASSVASGVRPGITIGIADATTAAQLGTVAAAKIPLYNTALTCVDHLDGTITVTDPTDADYPYVGAANSLPPTGITYSQSQAGVAAAPCTAVQTLLANGNTVTTST